MNLKEYVLTNIKNKSKQNNTKKKIGKKHRNLNSIYEHQIKKRTKNKIRLHCYIFLKVSVNYFLISSHQFEIKRKIIHKNIVFIYSDCCSRLTEPARAQYAGPGQSLRHQLDCLHSFYLISRPTQSWTLFCLNLLWLNK